MMIPPQFLDELRDKVLLSTRIGRKVKLTRRGREYTGLCPFHHEKTPSFTINDDKGFYHCFGCGAHGDIIRYLMEAEKMPFMEAVEHLAALAGMKVPQPSPEQRQMEQMRGNLTAVMEEACTFFQTQLFGMGGTRAKNYLIGRGISGTVAKQFRLGYAPSGSALTQHLQAKGYDMSVCQKLGIVAKNQKTGQWHDYFYDRVMFPILDRRRRVIGFGGRMMEKGEPKYLNSPETALFHKGEQLYALPNALDTIRHENTAVLVEGYMDVIALHSAGFTQAVAPLGTALTESQIKILWQSCDEPMICFDGDAAGQKAATRALYRALPILTAGKSLRFVTLPTPYDPDDIIRKKSPEAFAELLKESTGFSDFLWERILAAHTLDTPEKMALLEKDIRITLDKIMDPVVKGYYQKDFKNRLWKLTHTPRTGSNHRSVRTVPIHTPTPGLADARMMLAYVLMYPSVAEPMMETIAAIRLPDRVLGDILGQIARVFLENSDVSPEALQDALSEESRRVLSAELEMIRKKNLPAGDIQGVLQQIIRDTHRRLLQNEIDQKTDQYFQNPDAEVWENIKSLKKEIENLTESE